MPIERTSRTGERVRTGDSYYATCARAHMTVNGISRSTRSPVLARPDDRPAHEARTVAHHVGRPIEFDREAGE